MAIDGTLRAQEAGGAIFFGIDMGVSPQENQQYGNLTSASGFATNLGESDLASSSKFMQAILSGDSSKVSQVLAPQISAAKVSAQQNNKTSAELGTRSGGDAASIAATNDKTHSDVTDMIAELTGSSASGLSSAGSGLLSAGMSGDIAGFGEAQKLQQQKLSQFNNIIGSSASVASGVLGALPAGQGSFADKGGNFLAGMS